MIKEQMQSKKIRKRNDKINQRTISDLLYFSLAQSSVRAITPSMFCLDNH